MGVSGSGKSVGVGGGGSVGGSVSGGKSVGGSGSGSGSGGGRMISSSMTSLNQNGNNNNGLNNNGMNNSGNNVSGSDNNNWVGNSGNDNENNGNNNNNSNNNNTNNYMNNNNTENYRFRVEVQDTGAGISLSNQKKLFGQYVQFDANKLQKGDGSGSAFSFSIAVSRIRNRLFLRLDFRNAGAVFDFEDLIAQQRRAFVFQVRCGAGHFLFQLAQDLGQREVAAGFADDAFFDLLALQNHVQTFLHGALHALRRDAVRRVVFDLPSAAVFGDLDELLH